jgi:hypothetical protein
MHRKAYSLTNLATQLDGAYPKLTISQKLKLRPVWQDAVNFAVYTKLSRKEVALFDSAPSMGAIDSIL